MSRTTDVLLRPGRLATIAFVLAVAIVCVLLGRWQLSRMDEKRAINERLVANMSNTPLPLDDVIEAYAHGTQDELVEFHPVTVTGTWVPNEEVLQRNRSHEGRQGFWVATPLAIDGDRAVMVRRGWVSTDDDVPPVEAALPPEGTVTLMGLARLPEEVSGFGPRNPTDGLLERVFWINPSELDGQVTGDIVHLIVDVTTPQSAATGDLPPIPLPELDEANHLSYAIQWFAFAVIALVGIAAYARSRWFRDVADPVAS